MTPWDFYAELERLGLVRTGQRTKLTEEWVLVGANGEEFFFRLPNPTVLDTPDRRQALEIIQKTLGIGVKHGPN